MSSRITLYRGGSRTITDTTLLEFIGERASWDGDYESVEVKRALSPTNFPGIDYSLNPYGGCEHGCLYCYATGYTHSDPATWRVVRVRRNIRNRLVRELPSASGTIGIGTSTDPYQYAEGRFRLTRSCIEVLSDKDVPFKVFTKSDLVTRDIDILSESRCQVSITFTTVDDRISMMTEPGAPLPGKRLKAARMLCDAGIPTVALIAPVMSSLEGSERRLLESILDTGIERITCDPLNLRNVDTTRLDRMRIGPSAKAMQDLLEQGRLLDADVSDEY